MYFHRVNGKICWKVARIRIYGLQWKVLWSRWFKKYCASNHLDKNADGTIWKTAGWKKQLSGEDKDTGIKHAREVLMKQFYKIW